MEDLVDQMQSTLDNKDSFLGTQINDEDLQRRFNTLMIEIKTWSGRFNDGTTSPFRLDRLSEYQCVLPRCVDLRHLDKITADKKRKRLFVRGWAAYIMCTRLFRDLESTSARDLGGDVWLEKALAGDFKNLEDRFWRTDRKIIPHKTFNDWRALTAELLIKALDNTNEELNIQVQAAITGALSEVMELVETWHAPVPGTDPKVDEDKLRGTFVRAVQLARDLRRQRALWSVRFPSRPEIGLLKFDPATMQDVRDDKDEDEDDLEELKSFQVELVVTPTLFKRGTMNGEWFEREEAVHDCLAKVAISAPR
ncbi:hypothetical protein SVAN01_01063 [Stagonosporopsis vannaccii]|nr:hypothetical protein SVAN01_01063 [Stagonosporopsis vannaccii]